MPTWAERIAGGLVGLLVGDALGVPYEFHPDEAIPPLTQIEFDPPVGFARSHPAAPYAAWSDDGAQALCLLASLLERGHFDAEDFGRRIVHWYAEGYLAVEGKVFDVGIQTGRAIQRLQAGVPALEAGPTEERALGNGSLMRVLPLALWHRGTDAELVADAQSQSCVTHGHPRAQVCCALYCLWARRMLDVAADPWSEAVAALRALLPEESANRKELEWSVRPDDEPEGKGGGYVVDALRSARSAVGQGDYERAVKSAVALGNDTDTTACLAGGVAGLRDGIEAIPERWRQQLAGKDLYEPLLDQLLRSTAHPA